VIGDSRRANGHAGVALPTLLAYVLKIASAKPDTPAIAL